MKLANTLSGIALALTTTFLATVNASAQDAEVLLQSTDGSASLTGQLISFEDGFYTIDTDLGRFRVSSARMTCDGAGCPTIAEVEVDVRFAGSDTVGLGLMPLLLTGFANSQGAEADVTNGQEEGEIIAELIGDEGFGDKIGTYLVSSKTSAAAFPALQTKSADIGMSSRRITRQEAKDLKASGAGNMVSANNERVVAVDSLVVIINPANEVETVSIAQLAGIYSGQITNWSELGGADLPIKPVALQEGSGTRSIFERAIYLENPGSTQNSVEVAPNASQLAAAVNADAAAIGYVGYAFQRGAKAVNLTNQCGITVSPDTFSAKTEEYPMGRRLYLYNRSDALPDEAQAFLDYALSQNADGVIAKSGFIDLGIERIAQDLTGTRMQQIIQNTTDSFELGLMRELLVDMLQWERLSTTLRFKSGSSALSQKAQNDVGRLISYLENQPLGTEVAVVGFTDSDGAFEANRALSKNRAEGALQSIQTLSEGRLDNITFVSKGFGELSPSACNTNGQGKATNRRVEIWIRSPK